jgi:hypothetical protein
MSSTPQYNTWFAPEEYFNGDFLTRPKMMDLAIWEPTANERELAVSSCLNDHVVPFSRLADATMLYR